MSIALIGMVAAGGLFTSPHLPSMPHLPKITPPSLNLNDVHARKKRIAGWTIYIYKDSFTNVTTCRMMRQKLNYENSQLVFQFPASTDTTRATYRIDNGPPLLAIAPLDTFQSSNLASLDNPSGGRVALPIADVLGAKAVAIRPRHAHRAKTFKLTGLPTALDGAAGLGCPH